MPRPPIYDQRMTAAQRAERSRHRKAGEILSAVQFARLIAREIRDDMKQQPGCLPAFRRQLDALDAALDAADQAATPKTKIRESKRATEGKRA